MVKDDYSAYLFKTDCKKKFCFLYIFIRLYEDDIYQFGSFKFHIFHTFFCSKVSSNYNIAYPDSDQYFVHSSKNHCHLPDRDIQLKNKRKDSAIIAIIKYAYCNWSLLNNEIWKYCNLILSKVLKREVLLLHFIILSSYRSFFI